MGGLVGGGACCGRTCRRRGLLWAGLWHYEDRGGNGMCKITITKLYTH